MDNYISDTYGGRNSSGANSNTGIGLYNSLGNQNNSMNQGFEELYENQPNQDRKQNQVPQLTQIINKGGGNTALANRMAEIRAAKQSGPARGVTPQPNQRGRQGQVRIQPYTKWNNQCVIHNVSLPQLISNPSCSKRFKVQFTWVDEQGRPHQQDINFGGQGKAQFIDHQDPSLRDVRIAQLQQQTLINPLHPNFWQFNLLNKYPDLNVAYYKFVQENNLTGRKVFLQKDFKNNNTRTNTGNNKVIINRNLPQNNSMLESLDQYRYQV